jgi:hypothetical protein
MAQGGYGQSTYINQVKKHERGIETAQENVPLSKQIPRPRYEQGDKVGFPPFRARLHSGNLPITSLDKWLPRDSVFENVQS